MAMTIKADAKLSSLKRRIRHFYKLLNQRHFEQCHQIIDPRVRVQPSSVTLFQYENSLRQFLDRFRSVDVKKISLHLHLDEPSELYEGRDFALGQTIWTDSQGEHHVFSERWVLEEGVWYTRSTGFVTPAPAEHLSSVPMAPKQSRNVKRS